MASLRKVVQRLGRSRGGATAVEFALTGPILMLILYGIVEFSHYAWSDIALSDAAKSGARYAMVRGSTSSSPATGSSISAYVESNMPLLDPGAVNVSASFLPDNKPGSAVSVTVSYGFVPFLPGFGFLHSTQISATSQMTISQ